MPVALNFQSLGEGPPLLILHGLFGSGTNWRSIGKQLAGRRRVLLVDLRNHGGSAHAAGMSYPLLAADVRALMDREAIAQAAFLGHSMGGKTAMHLALENPDRVSHLIVVDIAPAVSHHDHRAVIAALESLDLGGVTRRGDADHALAAAIPDRGLRLFLLQNLVATEHGWRWRLNLAALRDAMPDLLGFPEPDAGACYPGPTLFIRGGRSDYLLPEHEARIRELFPAARIDTIADAAHWVHAEQPGRLVESIRAFLAR